MAHQRRSRVCDPTHPQMRYTLFVVVKPRRRRRRRRRMSRETCRANVRCAELQALLSSTRALYETTCFTFTFQINSSFSRPSERADHVLAFRDARRTVNKKTPVSETYIRRKRQTTKTTKPCQCSRFPTLLAININTNVGRSQNIHTSPTI